jgi:quinol monooxygenase YgiN
VDQYPFVQLHAARVRKVPLSKPCAREEAGCLSFHAFWSVRDRRVFFIHSRWVDNVALQVHTGLDHTLRFLKRLDALLDQPLDVTGQG